MVVAFVPAGRTKAKVVDPAEQAAVNQLPAGKVGIARGSGIGGKRLSNRHNCRDPTSGGNQWRRDAGPGKSNDNGLPACRFYNIDVPTEFTTTRNSMKTESWAS